MSTDSWDAAAIRRAFAAGTALDVRGPAGERRPVPAELLVRLLSGVDRAAPSGVPALRLRGAAVQGALALAGAEVTALAEFEDCTFDTAPDLRTATVAGLRWHGCRMPGLGAANLRVRGDLVLSSCLVAGIVLTDADIDGTLRLDDTAVSGPDGFAVLAERLTVSGALSACSLTSIGELRIPGAQVGGNVDLERADLTHPGADALDGTGLRVGGSLRCDGGFTADGRVVLAGATVGGSVVFSGATLQAAPDRRDGPVLVLPRGRADSTAALVADRLVAHGNVELDSGFATTGTVRLPQARIDGYLRLSGAVLGEPDAPPTPGRVRIALLADGIEVGADIECRGPADQVGRSQDRGALAAYGQVRLVDATVHGSASLSGARLHAPRGEALVADRLRVSGSLFLRRIAVEGSIRLQNAHIGSTVDCTGATLTEPRLREDESVRPSLDIRAATVGKDVLCSRGFRATGGVRLRRADVSKSVNFYDAVLGGPGRDVQAFNGYGLVTQELVLNLREPPMGDVRLTRASAASVFDGPELWAGSGQLDLEDFSYDSIAAPDEVGVGTRLDWLRGAIGSYDPDPYDQLAATYRDGGHEERADRVLLAKERYRHASMGPAGRIWGWLQEGTVGYGYRPWLAMVWLAGFWLAGSLWFGTHRLSKLDGGQDPAWNPVIYALDLLIPVVNLGQDNLWRTAGASAWVAGVLTLVGWTLVSTAAAGAARILRRS